LKVSQIWTTSEVSKPYSRGSTSAPKKDVHLSENHINCSSTMGAPGPKSLIVEKL
jgi:hypothetical protein